MGVDAGDFDNDGDDDLFTTAAAARGQQPLRQRRSGMFEDRSADPGWAAQPWLHRLRHRLVRLRQRRLARPDRGQRRHRGVERTARPMRAFRYDERKQLFRNLGDGRFDDVTAQAGRCSRVRSRAAAPRSATSTTTATWTSSISNIHRPARLLINQAASGHHWLGLRLVGGGKQGRDMPGARWKSRAATASRCIAASASTAATRLPTIRACSPASATPPAVSRIRITWPDGTAEERSDVPIDRWTTIRQGPR